MSFMDVSDGSDPHESVLLGFAGDDKDLGLLAFMSGCAAFVLVSGRSSFRNTKAVFAVRD